jgi:CO dehydrogenase maturation factor
MRIAFVGKWGSGKSTLTAAFIAWLSYIQKIEKILIIDADHNQHIRHLLSRYSITPSLFEHRKYRDKWQGEIRTSLPRDATDTFSFHDIIKTIELAEIGKLEEEKIGSRCYHGQIGEIEIFLNHCIDTKDEWIISDMTAGSDILGSSYFSKFDMLIGVCEPTCESLSVMQEIFTETKKYNVPLFILGNKISDRSDVEFLESRLGDYGWIQWYIEFSKIRWDTDAIQLDQKVFQTLWETLRKKEKDWKLYQKNLRIFHEKNISSWASDIPAHWEFSYTKMV